MTAGHATRRERSQERRSCVGMTDLFADLHPVTDALRWLAMHHENRTPDDWTREDDE